MSQKNRDLEERTQRFAKTVLSLCQAIPFNSINGVLITQVTRSSTSVGANYLEANEALSKKDFLYRVKISRKEAKETIYWLRLILHTNPQLSSECALALKESNELFLIFCRIVNKVELP